MNPDNSIFEILTIEEQLNQYTQSREYSERYETLWHAWKNNKRLLSQLLELTLPSFPTYSSHNESHAKMVLHNIEKILGRDGIRQLSATDCFMILNTVYLHDIGMCITAADRKEIVNSVEFVRLLDNICDNNADMKRAVDTLKQSIYAEHKNLPMRERFDALKSKYSEKLDVYNAIINLMAEFQRSRHAEKASNRINKWVLEDSNELGIGIRLSGIPLRIFLRIGDCARLHTDWNFQHILDLPYDDDGYAHDLMHPRFVAVMLQLGDALDLDNDRFHPFTLPFVGNLPSTSMLHFKKHQAIRRLTVTPKHIYIEADCENQQVYRLLRKECDALESILQKATYHWSEIAPQDLNTFLPTMHPPKLVLQGKEIPKELVNARFNISQSRAFRLIEGANIYEKKFAFLRELVQNALDATKLQAWSDLLYSSKYRELHDSIRDAVDIENCELIDVLRYVDIQKYPIIVKMGIKIRCFDDSDNEYLYSIQEAEHIEDFNKKHKNIEYGVFIQVQDYGTGISQSDLINISAVGSSYENRITEIISMPDCLKPTGEFGIGLQACFLVCDNFSAVTHTRFGEAYDMHFSSAANSNDGYINIKPINNVDHGVPYGTAFKLFISNSHKLPHTECMQAWDTSSSESDIFSSRYDELRDIRHSKELISQLSIYLDGLLNETIFPIMVEFDKNDLGDKYQNFIKSRLSNVITKFRPSNTMRTNVINNNTGIDVKCWLNNHVNDSNPENMIFVDGDYGVCALDIVEMRLYVWSKQVNTFAVFGARKLIAKQADENNSEYNKNTQVYLKGIHVADIDFEYDECLLEVLDIHFGMSKMLINLSRGGFTEEGLTKIREHIYPEIFNTALDGLYKLDNKDKADSNIDTICTNLKQQIENYKANGNLDTKDCSDNFKNIDICRRKVLSCIVLAYLHMHNETKSIYNIDKGNGFWQGLLNQIKTMLHSNEFGVILKLQTYLTKATVTDILDVFQKNEEKLNTCADLFDAKNGLAILSLRNQLTGKWVDIPLMLPEQQELLRRIKHTDSSDFFNDCSELIKWGDSFISDVEAQRMSILKGFRDKNQPNQSLFLWLLKNMQIEAQFVSKDDNCLLNILTYDDIPFSVLNNEAKFKILKKIQMNTTRYPRYSVTAWSNYFYLGFEKKPKSVFHIGIGPKTYAKKQHMIIPYTGTTINNIFVHTNRYEEAENDYIKEIKHLCEEVDKKIGLFNNYFEKLSYHNSDEELEQIAARFPQMSFTEMSETIKQLHYRFVSRLRDEYENMIKKYENPDGEDKTIKNVPELINKMPNETDIWDNIQANKENNSIRDLCECIYFLMNDVNSIIISQIRDSLTKSEEIDLKEKEFYKGMVSFYEKNTGIKRDILEQKIAKLQQEIITIIISHFHFDFLNNTQYQLRTMLDR